MTIEQFFGEWAIKAEMGTHQGEYEVWGHARRVWELDGIVKLGYKGSRLNIVTENGIIIDVVGIG